MSSATIVNSLASLREHYTAMLSESEHQANFAKEQLIHLNALLLDQVLPVGGAPAVAPAPVQVKAALAPAPEVEEEEEEEAEVSVIPAAKAKPAASAPEPRTLTRSGRKQFLRETALPLLRPYAGLTKTDAVAKVMEEHSGEIIYLDDVIKILHGTLDAVTLRQERARMRNLMWRGADRKLWDKVEGQESAYTYRAALLTPNSKVVGKSGRAARITKSDLAAAPAPLPIAAKPVTAKAAKGPKTSRGAKAAATRAANKAARLAKATKPAKTTTKAAKPTKGGKKATAIPDLGASLMGSVEKVLQANKGKPMTADEIALSLYGELDRNKLADVKKQISDRLAKGVKYKRWQRVANKIGVYMYA